MNILGINAYHPDASVVLLQDGVPIWAAEEERYSRLKHASGFPTLALQRCFQETGVSPAALDAVAIAKNPRAHLIRKVVFALKHRPHPKLLLNRFRALSKSSRLKAEIERALHVSPSSFKAQFFRVEHHIAHVSSSFFCSGFEKAAFLSLDGLGDFSSAMWGMGEENRLNVMDRVYFPHSAGFLYTAGTQFLGFLNFGDEYKVMGLAAYGKPAYLDEFRKMVFLKPKGKFELNLDYFVHQKGQAKIRWEDGEPEQDILYSARWIDRLGKPRGTDEPITKRDQDLAASLQVILEEIYFHVLDHLYRETQTKRLCLAGGVAFNSVANGKIHERTPFRDVFIQPAAGDAGGALGAACYVDRVIRHHPRSFVMDHVSFGSSATDSEIEKDLKKNGFVYGRLSEEELVQKTAEEIMNGKIVGWFQGKMEFGPRALGYRSILADPRNPRIKDILNERIKRRESFRPFAPAVPEEKASEYFEMDGPASPFMLKVYPVRNEKRNLIPAVTHVDGTARVQTVSKKANPLFWELLTAFGKETGVYVLLNTSFNENEPIVRTFQEALDCFRKTKMDVLVAGAYFLRKGDQGFR